MDRRWENSDASYDARNSISDKRSYQDHCDDLEDKAIVDLDNDYLNFHRLLTGQPAKHRPRNLEDERHYSVQKRIDLMFGEDDETPDKNDRGSEIDPDYALLCDATFEMQEKGCTVQGSVGTSKEHAKGREKGSLFHENDNVKNDDGTHILQKEVASEKESSAAAEQMETGNTIQTVQKPKGKAPAKKKKDPAKKKNAAGEDDDPKMENSDENDAVHGLLCLRNVA